jgi:tRNA A37 threonylcarbamoyladenosine synthetase subunit TsaC/SUA5/YrdC
VQQEVPNRLLANETVAVPTECTYEACFRLWYKTSTSTNTSNNDDNNDDHTDNIPSASINNTSSITTHNSNDQRLEHQTVQHQREHQLAIPHVYVPPSLESTFLQSSLLRARRYAMRDKETNVVAQVCSFSETHQVLQRLSSKLWPGPVLIYVALDTESTVSPLLQTERNGVSYVALRSPCHPLAVKVCQEYERCVDQHRDADSTNNDLSAVLVGLPLLESSSTNNNSGSHGNNNNNEYVTSALRVGESAVAATVDCVLNGEERREIFAVPTCEHRRPWPISLWINGKDRQVTILDASASATATATSSSSSNDLPQPLNVESVLQAVRSRNYSSSSTRAKKSPGTVFRDRMVQTILAKWTVLKEED